ncbi:MAG TPA: heme biosynthesis HemY N-terminal domain-containing protein [Nevskiaceae bacterium]|nr:heme biosynthesis HemY N-terminal domain-containing protein [Nevskiaceae bacterium]
MIAALFVLVAAAIGVAVMAFAHVDGGYALLAWGGWSVETSLAALVVALLILVAIIVTLVHLGSGAVHLPGRLRQGVQRRRGRRAQQSFEAGLLRFLQGDWEAAERDLVRRAGDRGHPALNYLAAARAAQHLGVTDRRDHYLDLAAEHAEHHDLKLAVMTTRAELQRERDDYPALLDSARAVLQEDSDNPNATRLLAEALAATGQWPELRDLLDTVAGRALDTHQRQALYDQAWLAGIQAAVAGSDVARLKHLWEGNAEAGTRPPLRQAYVDGLVQLGAETDALEAIGRTLDKDWDAALAATFARLHTVEPAQRLAAAERWLKRHGEHVELLQAAAQACLDSHLWGKAGTYLDTLSRGTPSPQVYLALARLAEGTQRPEDAARYYRDGLAAAIQRVPAHAH